MGDEQNEANEANEAELDDVEADRSQRLDPDNRPENVEVDNTDRTFDPEAGRFTDSEEYDEHDKPFPPVEEQGT